jgi:RNA polymerase sigma factor (sigma-70 family)
MIHRRPEGPAMMREPLSSVLDHARIAASRTAADAELLEQFLRGRDEAAFAALVRRHRPTVLAACRQVLADDADVEDAAQQTFLALWRNARSIRNRQSVGGWLFGVAHRLAVKGLARAKRRRVVESRAGKSRGEAAHVPDISWREACAILHEELDRLTDKHRLPLLLCYLDGKSRDETAKQLGWSVGAVKGHLERGRIRLRDRLARRGVTLSAGLLAAAAGTEATAGTLLPTTTILRSVADATRDRAAGFVGNAFRGARVVRRVVILAAAVTIGAAGVGARFGTPVPDDLPAASPPQALAPAAQPNKPVEMVTVSGRVLAPDGRPVAGARLFTFHSSPVGESREPSDGLTQRATADADGAFRFDAPKRDLYYEGKTMTAIPVVAGADGFGAAWAKMPSDGELTIKLVPDEPIHGRVIDTQGRPVAGATVRVDEILFPRTGRLEPFLNSWTTFWHDAYGAIDGGLNQPPQSLVRVTPTDREGRFRITGAGAERMVKLHVRGPGIAKSLVMIANRKGFDPALVNRAAAAREPAQSRVYGQPPELYRPTFDFVAVPAPAVEGTVREAGSRRPIAGVRVFASGRYGNDVEDLTDAAGHFRMEGLARTGATTLFGVQPPHKSPYLARHVSVANADGLQPLTVNAELARGVHLSGRVVDKATGRTVFADLHYVPLPDNPFFGKPPYDPDRQGEYVRSTEPDGSFHFAVIPGPGVLVARTHGDEMLDGQQLSPYLPGELSAEDRKHVKIVDRGGGQQIISLADGSLRPLGGNIYKVLDLAEGAGQVMLNLPLERGRTATLRIVDPDGRPLGEAIVAGLTATWPITYAVANAETKVYALDPAKPRSLVVFHEERNLAGTITVRGDEAGPLTVQLAPAATVAGRVLDAEGQPIAGAQVTLSHGGDSARELDRFLAQRRGPARTGADGRFQISGVVPGLSIGLQLRKGSTALTFPRPEKPPQLTAGQTLDLGEMRATPRQP